jgi:hypothetical protein
VVIAGVGLVVLWLRRSRMADAQFLSLSILIGLLVSPIVWSSYLVLLVVPLLLSTTDDHALAVVALASWVVVTPDAASPLRTAVGITLAAVVSGLAIHHGLGRRWSRWMSRPLWQRHAVVVAVLAGLGVLVVMPPAARSAVPALAEAGFAGICAIRYRTGSPLATG